MIQYYFWLVTECTIPLVSYSMEPRRDRIFQDERSIGFSKTVFMMRIKSVAAFLVIGTLVFSCSKFPYPIPEQDKGIFTDDRDKQAYEWIKIGDQVWMAQNLNFNTSSGSWCYEDDQSNCDLYGRLYNWETALSLACPSGWHLPAEEEWTVLEENIGRNAGKKMKSTKFWLQGRGNNWSGFNALPAGAYYYYSGFSARGEYTFFWTATDFDNSDARGRYLGYHGDAVGWTHFYKADGLSVRCVKD